MATPNSRPKSARAKASPISRRWIVVIGYQCTGSGTTVHVVHQGDPWTDPKSTGLRPFHPNAPDLARIAPRSGSNSPGPGGPAARDWIARGASVTGGRLFLSVR